MADANPQHERAERILSTAADLIAHYGYDKTTMDDIARAAGVSKGALYLHFSGKEDMFDALLLREGELLAEDIINRIKADPNGVTIFNLYRHALVGLAENPLMRALYTRDKRVLGDYLRRMMRGGQQSQMFQFGVDFVRQYQAAGYLRTDMRPEVMTYLLLIVRYGFLLLDEILPDAPMPSLEELGEELGKMLQRGLGPEKDGDNTAAQAALEALLDNALAYIRQMRQDRAQTKK